MTAKQVTARLNKLQAKLNITGGKIVGGAVLAASMLSLSQETQGANKNIDENCKRQVLQSSL